MHISPSAHFSHKPFMPEIQSLQPPYPPQRLRVSGIAFFVLRQYVPYGVELSVLAKQVAAAELRRRYIPYPHLTAPLIRGS